MRSSTKVASATLALCMVLLSFAARALVEPKADVATATLAWGQALGEDDPEKVLPFYSDDAVLWGHAVADCAVRPGGATRLFRDRLQGSAQSQGRLRRSVDPRVRECSGKYRLLHVLLRQGWRDQELA